MPKTDQHLTASLNCCVQVALEFPDQKERHGKSDSFEQYKDFVDIGCQEATEMRLIHIFNIVTQI